MRGLTVLAWGLLAAVVIGIIVAIAPWLTANRVPTVDETLSQPEAVTAQQEESGPTCEYCRPLDELRNAFLRRVEDAQHRVAILKDSVSSREAAGEEEAGADIPLGTLKNDLATGERNLSAARAAVERIHFWRSQCQNEAICRPSSGGSVVSLSLQSRCSVMTDSVLATISGARKLSEQVMALGTSCEGKTCPASDCTKGHELRLSLAKLASALDALAGPGVYASVSEDLADIRRAAEIRDVGEKASEEIAYTSRLFPMMFDDSTETSAAEILSMANARLRSRVTSLSRASDGPILKAPADAELSWWLRLLKLDIAGLEAWSAADVSALRRDNSVVEHWGKLSDDLGSALLHAAKVDVSLKRSSAAPTPDPTSCPASQKAADVAAIAKAALAALAICTRRSGCEDEEASLAPPSDAPSAVALLTEAVIDTRTALLDLAVAESEPPSISLGGATFDAGEAIQIRLETARSQCLAGSKGVLRLTKLSSMRSRVDSLLSLGGQDYLPAPQAAGNYKITLESPASRGGVTLAETQFAVAKGAMSCNGFDGRWQTDFGYLNLKVRGDKVTGSYRRTVDDAPGIIVGSLSGNILRGQWQAEGDEGGLELVLDASAQRFSGDFGRTGQAVSGGGKWTGECSPSADVDESDTPVLPN